MVLGKGMVCVILCVVSLGGMNSPEKGSLNLLRAKQDGPRKVVLIEEEKYYGILVRYVITFSTGSIGYSSYSPYDEKGRNYAYVEKAREGRVVINRAGRDAKIVFDEYQSFYRRLTS